jgi:hypothetical protein
MTKPRSDKKLEPRAAADPKILPMDLRVGDRLADETGEWEVIGRPYTTSAGKDARARVRRIGQPDVTEIRIWRAHEREADDRRGGQAMMRLRRASAIRRILLAHLGCDGPRRLRVGFVAGASRRF